MSAYLLHTVQIIGLACMLHVDPMSEVRVMHSPNVRGTAT